MGLVILGAGCKGAGTERTTLFVPPTSVVMTTVLDAADDDACVTGLGALDFNGDDSVAVAVTAVLVTVGFWLT